MSGETQPSISGPIPAGWYPDPAGGDGKRWWDGTVWTHNVREPEAQAPAPTFGTYVHAEFRPSIPLPVAEVGVAYTRASWWIAGSPLWLVVPQAAVVELFNSVAPLPTPTLILGVALFTVLGWIILVALAFADRAGLRRTNATTASPWWMLLSALAYLIMRARQVRLYASGGWASVIWWCLAAFITPGVAVAAVFAIYGLI